MQTEPIRTGMCYDPGLTLRSIKLSVLRGLRDSGVFALVARSGWRRSQLLILCYHGISLRDEHLWNPGLYISRDEFSGRMDLIRSGGCNVLPLGEALNRLSAGELPPRAVAITFDDGFFDFCAVARPILGGQDSPRRFT